MLEGDNILSLEKIVDIITNSVMGGLTAITNFSFSKEQISDEVIINCNRILEDIAIQGKLDPRDLYQDINCIDLECKDISECCNLDSGENVLRSVLPIPKLANFTGIDTILYLGLVNKARNFKLTNQLISGEFNKYSFSGKLNLPTCYIDNKYYIIIRNPPTTNLKKVSLTAIFENPESIYQYSCMCDDNIQAFKRPQWLIDRVTNKLILDYLRYYRLGSMPQPNLQEQIPVNNVK